MRKQIEDIKIIFEPQSENTFIEKLKKKLCPGWDSNQLINVLRTSFISTRLSRISNC